MVDALTKLLTWLISVNNWVLRIGKTVAWVVLVVMVIVILLQVFFRYVLNSALSWPDEAARFMMLWMTCLIAPLAYRHGGFVAIEMVPQALPRSIAGPLMLAIWVISLIVLLVAAYFGWGHTMGFGGNFDSSSLKIPLDLIGFESMRVKLRYMYGSLLVGMWLLISVNIELMLRMIITMIRPDAELPSTKDPAVSMTGFD